MNLPKIAIEQHILFDVNKALSREWLITNGLGGYASSTVLGINTRKYHGLLVAAFNPPVRRWVLLTKLDETIGIGNRNYNLGANEFQDVIYPKGYHFLSKFTVNPCPTFRYTIEDVIIKKTVFMPYMKNATAVIYEAINPMKEKVTFNISPLVSSRHIYTTIDHNKIQWQFTQKHQENAVTIKTSDSLSCLILSTNKDGSFVEESWWINKMFFRDDASRSESSIDDCFRPGYFKFSVNPKEIKRIFMLAVGAKNTKDAQETFASIGSDINLLYDQELKRRKALVERFSYHNSGLKLEDWLKWLVQAADSFVVSRASTSSRSVIAGYHWFDDWGRDALISFPGLTLITGRFDDAKEILLMFEHYCSKGVIPNRFSDKAGDIPFYNTVDATLWFYNAILQYLKYTGDFDFVQQKLWNTLNEIIDFHVEGTIFGIHMEKDGLIAHGPQLTWMDATTVDGFVTPRNGKAVEIQALWYNTLKTMQLLAKRFNQPEKAENYFQMAEKTKESFVEQFWNPEGYLYDLLTKEGADSTFRPNQLIVTSLDFSILDTTKRKMVVNTVWKRLWGVYGLKTLPETDSRYIGNYLGDWRHRDTAYHNGTVWAWLLGPFITSFLKTKNHEEPWRKFAFQNFLQPLFQKQLVQAGLGTISEIFDGNLPHIPRGCIAQAWSVAEPLRAYIEDIVFNRPPHEKNVLSTLKSN